MKVIEKKYDRYERMIKFLKENNHFSTVKEISEFLGVSNMTVYRDVEELCEKEVLSQVYGGIILNQDYMGSNSSFSDFYSVKASEEINIERKERIARKAISLVEHDDVILIDSGSTTEHFARLLPTNIPLTILCHATNILYEVQRKPNCRIFMAGGFYHSTTQCFESNEGLSLIRRVRTSKAFISASGVSDKLGATCYHMFEAETKKAIMETSNQKILLADSSKFGKITNSFFANLDDFDIVITDKDISQYYKKFLEDTGKIIYIV
jgi:DeoR family deoxyribose operon repressor